MLHRALLLAAVFITIYLLTQTYPFIDLKNSARPEQQSTELTITNSDNPEELRRIATQTLHKLASTESQHSEKAFRQLILLVGLLVCLLPLFFLSGSGKYPFKRNSGSRNTHRVGKK